MTTTLFGTRDPVPLDNGDSVIFCTGRPRPDLLRMVLPSVTLGTRGGYEILIRWLLADIDPTAILVDQQWECNFDPQRFGRGG